MEREREGGVRERNRELCRHSKDNKGNANRKGTRKEVKAKQMVDKHTHTSFPFPATKSIEVKLLFIVRPRPWSDIRPGSGPKPEPKKQKTICHFCLSFHCCVFHLTWVAVQRTTHWGLRGVTDSGTGWGWGRVWSWPVRGHRDSCVCVCEWMWVCVSECVYRACQSAFQ